MEDIQKLINESLENFDYEPEIESENHIELFLDDDYSIIYNIDTKEYILCIYDEDDLVEYEINLDINIEDDYKEVIENREYIVTLSDIEIMKKIVSEELNG